MKKISLWATVLSPNDLPTDKKRLFNLPETLHALTSWYINVRNFRVLVKQLFYGNETQFQVWKLGKNLHRISLWFFSSWELFVKWTRIRITGNSFVKFSVHSYERPTYLPPSLPQKGSLIFLKLGTLKVHDK